MIIKSMIGCEPYKYLTQLLEKLEKIDIEYLTTFEAQLIKDLAMDPPKIDWKKCKENSENVIQG